MATEGVTNLNEALPTSIGVRMYVVAKHAHSDWIAEYYNFWSNLAFCVAALIGIKRCVELKLSVAFWAAEVVMCFGIGFGSMIV
ncbi:expressed unknown protein [Seminavis robusta]|uniref:Uncharacterized protein n=1 Tax=Seminavis robusta TaxID=568900 RepID=A0A9N8E139_9STRA|nr:expressed unknown protein [Seminavis robusta]|eukprot:Sro543_g163550.1 n/a (84) ;mRNA; f:30719-30970